MERNAVIFDLNGTLVDSVPDVRLALNATLATYGLPPIARDKIFSLIGKGASSLITDAFAMNGMFLSGDSVQEALTRYLNHYKTHPVVETRIYPGVTDILEELQANKFKLAICTNKPSVMTKIVLQQLKLESYFSVIIAGDEIDKPKPHAAHLQAVMDRMNINPCHAVMVGDSDIDLNCAMNANIPFIGVSYGYHHGTLKADNMINHFNELPHALRTLTYA